MTTNYRPTKKVSAAAATGAVVTLLSAVASQFGVELTQEVVAALNTVLMIGAAYLVREGKIIIDGDIDEIPEQGPLHDPNEDSDDPDPEVLADVQRRIEENPPDLEAEREFLESGPSYREKKEQ